MMIERRCCGQQVSAEGRTIRGTASPVYDGSPGTEYELMPDTYERFAAGAFDGHLRTSPDVVCTFNHSPDHVLARTPQTLRLRTDNHGLHYEAELPETTVAKDLLVSIARGDIRGSSFAFMPLKVEWQRDGKKDVRLIREARLYDVSPVTHPSYGGSSVGLRSEERRAIEQERDDYRNRLETEKRFARWEEITRQ